MSDITPLAGLTKLQYLHLAGNKVAKIDALKDLTALSALYLSKNEISDIAPLAKLTKLSSLYLDGNKISDLKPLAGITRLSSLDLKENAIVDLSPLAKQTDLKMLFLQKNKITDLKPLVDWLKADAKGEKRVAPYLFLYLEGQSAVGRGEDEAGSRTGRVRGAAEVEGRGQRSKSFACRFGSPACASRKRQP